MSTIHIPSHYTLSDVCTYMNIDSSLSIFEKKRHVRHTIAKTICKITSNTLALNVLFVHAIHHSLTI